MEGKEDLNQKAHGGCVSFVECRVLTSLCRVTNSCLLSFVHVCVSLPISPFLLFLLFLLGVLVVFPWLSVCVPLFPQMLLGVCVPSWQISNR